MIKLSTRFAWSYAKPTQRKGFVSFLTLMAILGIALSVASLIVVLSAVRGFETTLRNSVLSVVPHAQMVGISGPLPRADLFLEAARMHPEVKAVATYVETEALAVGQQVKPVLIKGVEPALEKDVLDLSAFSSAPALSELTKGEFHVLLGAGLAQSLNVNVGDRVTFMISKADASVFGANVRQKAFVVKGLFKSGLYEFDHGVAMVHQYDLSVLLKTKGQVSGVSLQVVNPEEAPRVVREVATTAGGGALISDWTRQHRNFFKALKTTQSVMALILLVVLCVAVFNIFASLTMLVRDKGAQIAMLRAMGASTRLIKSMFIQFGVCLALIGSALGVVLGLLLSHYFSALLSALEMLLNTELVDPSIYFIERFNAVVDPVEVVMIVLGTWVLAMLAAWWPARQAARLLPAKVLRGE